MSLRFVGLALVLAAGCDQHPFTQSLKLGGKVVSAETLNHGHDGYQQYCRPCHGEKGDGKGYSSFGLRPPPRDFSQGLFKFGHVQAPKLPPDSELKIIVRGGLHGTAMLSWDIPDGELDDILQYIKTFSPKWQSDDPGVGTVIEMSPDPYGEAKKQEAIALGEKLYHAKAQCSGCHPAFVSHEKLYTLTKEMTGTGQTDFTAEMYLSQPKETEYCLEWKPGWKKLDERECAKPVKILPPNFTRDPLRTVHTGTELNDLYKTIAAGIGGANMPTWKGALKEEELWGLVYYVKSLVEMRGTPAAKELYARLTDPANLSWVPPKAAETPPPGGAAPAPGGAAPAPGAPPPAAPTPPK
jgi:mono/diheme cytochrome c family protein